jgi:hypothetical protein
MSLFSPTVSFMFEKIVSDLLSARWLKKGLFTQNMKCVSCVLHKLKGFNFGRKNGGKVMINIFAKKKLAFF